MVSKLLGFLGDSNEKALKELRPTVARVNALEPEFQSLSDDELQARTEEFKRRLQEGEELDDLLPEAFAAVREAAKRTLGQRHYDVQLLGGIVLHQGKIAEMKTGEGKTLVATLPVYLNALAGRGVHVVTVNDYLAKRDTQWMGPIYHKLGLRVGCLQHDASYLLDLAAQPESPSLRSLRPVSRREVYQADIVYGTNSEFGFDYLRDNMVADLSQCVQRELAYAIVDEVDNILIDEARTPLIISGPARESTDLYPAFARLVPRLQEEGDYAVDHQHKAATLTEAGISKMERWLNVGNLYDPSNYHLTHFMENALRALVFYRRDTEYVVKDGEVILVDEFTGRLMPGRRLADGLHQAIEAKEGQRVQRETITYATITLQNYFRMYEKLAGMTGTAATEAEEFWKIYKLDVVVIPTHKPMIRHTLPDRIYSTEEGKFRAIAREIEELNRAGRPVLVGTVSIERSEMLGEMLRQGGIPHQILNAKHHEREAAIVAEAGRPGAVTVATNMAGRGTDIVLGGNPAGLDLSPEEWERDHQGVVELGGLHILGSERHEARRIDNQLRGRSGRQGDPGSSRFYVSLEDEILRRFGGERVRTFMEWAGLDEDTPIENRLVSRAIENAQVRVEAYHFDIRKHLVEYDDVVNRHREVIYDERRKILAGADLKANIGEVVHRELDRVVDTYLPGEEPEQWNVPAFLADLGTIFSLDGALSEEAIPDMRRGEVVRALHQQADALYEQRERELGEESMRTLERLVMLRVIDSLWVQHLTSMENLRQGIGLHAAGQRDPLMMYKMRGHEYFQDLLARIQHDVVHTIYRVGLVVRPIASAQPSQRAPVATPSKETPITAVGARHRSQTGRATAQKVGRNEPCPCGSGKKYKKCHGMG